MTKESTLRVALDQLREAFGTDEDVAAIVARELKMEVWVLEISFPYEGERLLGVFYTEAAARAAAEKEHEQRKYDGQELNFTRSSYNPALLEASSGSAELWITKQPVED